MTTPIEMTCLIAGGGGRLLELAGQLTRSRKSSGPQRGTALQRGEGVGFGQDFRPCPRCSGATTVGVEWADVA